MSVAKEHDYLKEIAELVRESLAGGGTAERAPSRVRATQMSAVDKAAYARIKKMRSVRARPEEHSRAVFVQDVSVNMVEQLRFMQDFEDDFANEIELDQDFMSLDEFSSEQLRSYFSWRSRVRKGRYETGDPGKLKLYYVELVNNIGVASPEDGIRKILALWRKVRDYMIGLDEMVIDWIKDYYICNEFEESFREYIEKYNVAEYFPEACEGGRADGVYDLLYDCVGYAPEQPRYFSKRESARNAIKLIFEIILRNLTPLFRLYGVELANIMASNTSRRMYVPFSPLVSLLPQLCERSSAQICARESYHRVGGYWFRSIDGPDDSSRAMLLWIARTAERAVLDTAGYSRSREGDNGIKISSSTLPITQICGDARFKDIVTDAARLCAGHLSQWKLTVPRHSPELLSPLSEAVRISIETEPAATFLRMRNLRIADKTAAFSPESFYNAAKMMEWFACEADASAVKCDAPPLHSYDFMDNAHLAAYFAWRARYRAGDTAEVPGWFALLYAQELLHGVGAEHPLDTLRRLAGLLRGCQWLDRKSRNRLLAWLRDYFAVHVNIYPENKLPRKMDGERLNIELARVDGFTMPFVRYLHEWKLLDEYPELVVGCEADFDRDGLPIDERTQFEIYASISSYKIDKSRFYIDSYKRLVCNCFARIWRLIEQGMGESEASLSDFLVTSKSADHWIFCKDALVYDEKALQPLPDDRDKVKELKRFVLKLDAYRKKNAREIYKFRVHSWTHTHTAVMTPHAGAFVGAVMRTMESHLRRAASFKPALSAPEDIVESIAPLLAKTYGRNSPVVSALRGMKLEGLIERCAAESVCELYPHGMAAGIAAPAAKRKVADEPIAPVAVSVDFSALDRVRVEADWVFSKLTDGQAISEEEYGKPVATAVSIQDEEDAADDSGDAEESWAGLASALSPRQKEALGLLLSDSLGRLDELRALIEDSGEMPEPFFEKINELSLEYIGDTLVESSGNTFLLLEDYRDDARAIVA